MFETTYFVKLKIVNHRYDLLSDECKKELKKFCTHYNNLKYYDKKKYYNSQNKYARIIIDDYCKGLINFKDLNI